MKRRKVIKWILSDDYYHESKFKVDSMNFRILVNRVNKIFENKKQSFYIGQRNYKIILEVDEEGSNVLSDFFIIPRAQIIVEKENKRENFLLLRAYSYTDEIRVDFIIKQNELGNREWFDRILEKETFNLYDKTDDNIDTYDILRKTIEILVKSDVCKEYYIDNNIGWTYNRGKTEWRYGLRRQCYKCINSDGNDFSSFFQELFNTIEVEDTGNCFSIFSYCLLGIKNEILREAGIEPSFVLHVVSEREHYGFQMLEFFTGSMNPEKGSILHCKRERRNICSIYNDHFIIDTLDNSRTMVRKFVDNKDKVVILDCMNMKGFKGILHQVRNNYNRRNAENGIKSGGYSLPVLVTSREDDNELLYTVDFNHSNVNTDKLIALRSKSHILNSIIISYIEWLEEELSSDYRYCLGWFVGEYKDIYRSIYYNSAELTERSASSYAWLLLAFKSYLRFGLSIKQINEQDSIMLYKKAYSIIAGIEYDEQEPLKNLFAENKTRQELENKMLYDCLKVINHMYENNLDLFQTARDEKLDSQIGWYFTEKGRNKHNIICIKKSEFDDVISRYVKQVGARELHNIGSISINTLNRLLFGKGKANSIAINNNNEGRKEFLVKKNNVIVDVAIAFDIKKVKELLEEKDRQS